MPLLRFLRFPGVFTALADIFAGYLILRFAGAGEGAAQTLPYLLGASACLYMAGMAWNDIFDFETDAKERPDRPLPSGMLGLTQGFLLAGILTIAGLMLAMVAGLHSFLVAAVLLVCILLYDGGMKHLEGVGPVVMGACRGANLLLGMTAHSHFPDHLSDARCWLPPVLLVLYTAFITLLATVESGGEEEETALSGTLKPGLQVLTIAGLFLVPCLVLWLLPSRPVLYAMAGIHVLFLASGGYALIRTGGQRGVQRMVGCAILGIPLLDACFVAAATRGQIVSLPALGRVVTFLSPRPEEIAGVLIVALLLIPAKVVRKWIAIT